MTNPDLFRPGKLATVNVAPTGTSASVALTSPASATAVRVKNTGTVRLFYEIGTSTVTAVVATSTPLDPGESEMLSLLTGDTHIAAITAGSAGSLHATTGVGY